MSNLLIRVVSASIFLPFFIFFLTYNIWSYFFLFYLISNLCIFELLKIFKLSKKSDFIFTIVSHSFLYILYFFDLLKVFQINFLSSFALTIFFFLSKKIFKFEKNENILKDLGLIFFSFCYITIPFSFALDLAFFNEIFEYKYVLFTFLIIWSCDSGAYFFGRKFGKDKMAPLLSPKKSWQGAFGGVFVSIFFSFFFNYFFDISESNLKISFLSFLISIASIFGDLIESMIKRIFDIKDSGKLIPGHGGFLDRFDSFLFAIVVSNFFIRNFI
jgi:phosphatidate cytidylyltransferase